MKEEGRRSMQKYVVLQVTLKEKLIGTSSKNLSELEDVINKQADKGYRLQNRQIRDIGYIQSVPHQAEVRDLEAETVFRLRWYLKELNKKN